MIDIIIPVYNTPLDDLNRCFTSIINQSYCDYKIIIIDDGSNDTVRLYLDDFVRNHDKFNVIHIKIIGGYNEIKKSQKIRTRICQPGLHIYDEKNVDNFMEKLLSSKTNENNREIADCPIGRIYNRLFKKSSIGDLRFDTNIHMSEDTLFMIDYVKKAKRIGIVDKVWYNYYINDYSISNATNKKKMINNIKGFIKQIEIRRNMELKENLRKAYQDRIDKSNKHISRIMQKKL